MYEIGKRSWYTHTVLYRWHLLIHSFMDGWRRHPLAFCCNFMLFMDSLSCSRQESFEMVRCEFLSTFSSIFFILLVVLFLLIASRLATVEKDYSLRMYNCNRNATQIRSIGVVEGGIIENALIKERIEEGLGIVMQQRSLWERIFMRKNEREMV